jgi:hypothetical protein
MEKYVTKEKDERLLLPFEVRDGKSALLQRDTLDLEILLLPQCNPLSQVLEAVLRHSRGEIARVLSAVVWLHSAKDIFARQLQKRTTHHQSCRISTTTHAFNY